MIDGSVEFSHRGSGYIMYTEYTTQNAAGFKIEMK